MNKTKLKQILVYLDKNYLDQGEPTSKIIKEIIEAILEEK